MKFRPFQPSIQFSEPQHPAYTLPSYLPEHKGDAVVELELVEQVGPVYVFVFCGGVIDPRCGFRGDEGEAT